MKSHQPKKRLGQNFLTDEFIIHMIVQSINPRRQDHLVEIGPGLGAITLPLLSLVDKIDAIELDRDVIPSLQKKAMDRGHLIIHQQDILTFDLATIATHKKSLRIVGNLPYNISTPLLFHLLQQKAWIIDMHFMLQKEVAERLIAIPGNKQYGRLSVMAQYHCFIEPLLDVPPSAFTPSPQVHSMFIRLEPMERERVVAKNWSQFDSVVKQAFGMRRKTIHNALKNRITKEQLISLDIDPNKRPEQLTVENFVIISNLISTD